jgi:AraC-like DNA-binding protein
MAGRSHFKTPRWARSFTVPASTPKDRDGLLALYQRHVARRFTRITGLRVVTFPFELPSPTGALFLLTPPAHPQCAAHADSADCAEEWNDHVQQLRRRPSVHTHECPFGQHCSVVPLVWKGRCLSAAKLVCAGDMSEEDFSHHVEVLDLLTGNFITGVAAWLGGWFSSTGPHRSRTPKVTRKRAISARSAEHVERAVEYIKRHYRDPTLKVEDVGPALGFNAHYLGRLFIEATGHRLHEHLADCRLRYARTLLGTTRQPIKVVALQSGFLHPKWFSELFRDRFDLSPTAFRRSTPALAKIMPV